MSDGGAPQSPGVSQTPDGSPRPTSSRSFLSPPYLSGGGPRVWGPASVTRILALITAWLSLHGIYHSRFQGRQVSTVYSVLNSP